MVMSVGNVFLLLFKDHITFISYRDKVYPADNKEKTILKPLPFKDLPQHFSTLCSNINT